MDTTALLNLTGTVALASVAVVVGAWLERSVRAAQVEPVRELVRADGHPDATPAEAFQHAEGATAWTR